MDGYHLCILDMIHYCMSDGNTFSYSEACLSTLPVVLFVNEFLSTVLSRFHTGAYHCEQCDVTIWLSF